MDFQKRQPQHCYNRRLVQDILAEHSERLPLSTWTDQEEEIFRQKFIQFPKEFGKIASFLEKKTVPDCVQYSCTTKKTEKYKELVRESRGRDRSKKNACGK
ncbi:hypothetical protein HPB50_015309 [Hyalomma asiaticum]|uniref:Uncharacterized protein n=1 Tax=Hyalomma asiaticum TaxID=266040 RepID=A0ACB7TJ06_HYAAI|nr:hypothetical protein HPB50_015309 [Hyalomma asiaticum]